MSEVFAVVRHPDIATPGIIPRGALESHRARGWYRVSEWTDQPSDLHLPDYADADDDLDAEPEPEAPKKRASRKKTDESPAEPADDDEEQEA
jgi:hypothetical protein